MKRCDTSTWHLPILIAQLDNCLLVALIVGWIRNRQTTTSMGHHVCSRQVAWWRHHVGVFSAWLVLCEGNLPVIGGFLSQRSVTRIFMISLIRAWTNVWANNRDAGGLGRHRSPHYVTVMESSHRFILLSKESQFITIWWGFLWCPLSEPMSIHISYILCIHTFADLNESTTRPHNCQTRV